MLSTSVERAPGKHVKSPGGAARASKRNNQTEKSSGGGSGSSGGSGSGSAAVAVAAARWQWNHLATKLLRRMVSTMAAGGSSALPSPISG